MAVVHGLTGASYTTSEVVRQRVALFAGCHRIGSLHAKVAEQLLSDAVARRLLIATTSGAQGLRLTLNGEATVVLAQLALCLRALALTQPWRNELLSVHDVVNGLPVAAVERAAVRALGISTRGVHLHASTADGGAYWVQQRAMDKATDPGLWDTLMGGMVSADETLLQALWRETGEEAGLGLTEFDRLQHGGAFWWQQGSAQDADFLHERIDWFTARLRPRRQPVNLDGEVAQFAQMDAQGLWRAIAGGWFTHEAGTVIQAAAAR